MTWTWRQTKTITDAQLSPSTVAVLDALAYTTDAISDVAVADADSLPLLVPDIQLTPYAVAVLDAVATTSDDVVADADAILLPTPTTPTPSLTTRSPTTPTPPPTTPLPMPTRCRYLHPTASWRRLRPPPDAVAITSDAISEDVFADAHLVP